MAIQGTSWEEVTALFRHGYAEVYLQHFCQLVATRDSVTSATASDAFGYSSSPTKQSPPALAPKAPSSPVPSRGLRHNPHIVRPSPAPQATESPRTGPACSNHRTMLMLSGRFNSEENVKLIQEVKEELHAKGVPVYMVQAGSGQTFNERTMKGMYFAKKMAAFCTDDYGAKTGAGYETYFELQKAREKQVSIIPIRLSKVWPPQPDLHGPGTIQNDYVFGKGLLYIDAREMPRDMLIAELERAWKCEN